MRSKSTLKLLKNILCLILSMENIKERKAFAKEGERIAYIIYPKIPLKKGSKNSGMDFVKPITRLGVLTGIEIGCCPLPEETSEAMREIQEIGLHNALTSTLAKISFELGLPIRRIPDCNFLPLINLIYWLKSVPQMLKFKNGILFPPRERLLYGYSDSQELLIQYYYEGLVSKDAAIKFIQFYKILEFNSKQAKKRAKNTELIFHCKQLDMGLRM